MGRAFAGRCQKEADIQLTVHHVFQHAAAHAVVQLRFQLGCAGHQAAQKIAQADEFRVHDGADAQLAAQGAVQGTGALFECQRTGQGVFGGGQQGIAIGSEAQALRAAGEQRQAKVLLKLLQL